MTLRSIVDVPAPAKLNLFLHVVGRRADGYHLLQSVFVLIDWCDALHFERRDDARLVRRDLGAPLPADDLCLRAATALQQASGTAFGVDLSIDKRIPAGAGMGGGSSDAAATLLALNRLWRLDWPLGRLLPIGLALGADVPFFLGGKNAFVEGIGERLTPVALPAAAFAVVKPAASLDTRRIFASPRLVRDTPPVIIEDFRADGREFFRFGRNDLQPPAVEVCPEVGQAVAWLDERYGNSRMTGSGSAVYARIDPQAPAIEEPALPAGWQARTCESLPLHPLAGWAAGQED